MTAGVPPRDSAHVRYVSTAAYGPGKGALLPHLDVELTERCNNRCIHCYINLPQNHAAARHRELDTATVARVLEEAASLGCLSVRFTGGEPLLRPDFADIYLRARRLGMLVTLYTNARLVTPELAELLARVPPKQPVEVTVLGASADTYEALSGVRGSYGEFRRGIDLLRQHRVPFVLKTVLLQATMHEMDEMQAWAQELAGRADPPGAVSTFHLRARRDSAARNEVIRGLRHPPQEMVALLQRLDGAYDHHMGTFCRRLPGPPGDGLFGCSAGRAVCLDAYGGLQACMLLRHPAATYDLRQGSLREALERFFPALRERRAAGPAYLERCARCFLHSLCDQCPGTSWSEHGTLDTPVEYLCALAHAEAQAAGLIRQGEKGWEVQDWKERIACRGR